MIAHQGRVTMDGSARLYYAKVLQETFHKGVMSTVSKYV